MRASKTVLGATLIAGLFAAGCGDKGPAPATGIQSIQGQNLNPYGEIPYDRNLLVNKYEMLRLRDIHTRKTGEVVATVYTTFSTGEGQNADSEPITLQLTKESEDSANMIANNFSKCNVVTIPGFEYDPKGNQTDIVRSVPYAGALFYRMPASRLKCAEYETHDVKTTVTPKKGFIDNDGVHRPWERPQNQLEKPCIPDDPYKSPCAVPTPTAPASGRTAGKTVPTPAPTGPSTPPAAPARPSTAAPKGSAAKEVCTECGTQAKIKVYGEKILTGLEEIKDGISDLSKKYPKE